MQYKETEGQSEKEAKPANAWNDFNQTSKETVFASENKDSKKYNTGNHRSTRYYLNKSKAGPSQASIWPL